MILWENTYSQIFIHLVYSTKKRAPILMSGFEENLKKYITDNAWKHELQILAIGGTEDHLHVLLIIPPKFSVSKAAQIIKGGSSRWLNKNYFEEKTFRWQRGYGAFSINKSMVPTTINYIKTQKEHHKETAYEDEFLAFLKKHEIEYQDRNCSNLKLGTK
ncbi:MAG TPA: IS200/IS605 family transposase [Balneolaceae bacterium]|nr:IS200/IS605 family transposase [Balneolaceae bacterium]